MTKSNRKKTEALGMSIGTASGRLRKRILFSLVCKLEENVCFQCGDVIETVDDLSIEHKEPWLNAEDPVEVFFDLDNIAFSHLSCNIGARDTRKYFTVEEKQASEDKRKSKWYYSLSKEDRQERRRKKYKKHGF